MTDLIDRSETQTELMMKCERYTLARESHGFGRVEWSGELISLSDAMDVIRDMPTAERRGHWVRVGREFGFVFDNFYCSECNLFVGVKPTNYCPNCGARMEAENVRPD